MTYCHHCWWENELDGEPDYCPECGREWESAEEKSLSDLTISEMGFTRWITLWTSIIGGIGYLLLGATYATGITVGIIVSANIFRGVALLLFLAAPTVLAGLSLLGEDFYDLRERVARQFIADGRTLREQYAEGEITQDELERRLDEEMGIADDDGAREVVTESDSRTIAGDSR